MGKADDMVPIWQRRKSSVKKEEYDKFYRDKFHDYAAPQRVIAVSAEGAVTYKALLFIPGSTPFDYYTKEYEKGLQLYSNGVLIMSRSGAPDHRHLFQRRYLQPVPHRSRRVLSDWREREPTGRLSGYSAHY